MSYAGCCVYLPHTSPRTFYCFSSNARCAFWYLARLNSLSLLQLLASSHSLFTILFQARRSALLVGQWAIDGKGDLGCGLCLVSITTARYIRLYTNTHEYSATSMKHIFVFIAQSNRQHIYYPWLQMQLIKIYIDIYCGV